MKNPTRCRCRPLGAPKLLITPSCSSKLLIEQLSYNPINTGVLAKLLKLLMRLRAREQLGQPHQPGRPKLLKLLTPLTQMSNLAETRMDSGLRLSCSMSNLDEQLRIDHPVGERMAGIAQPVTGPFGSIHRRNFRGA